MDVHGIHFRTFLSAFTHVFFDTFGTNIVIRLAIYVMLQYMLLSEYPYQTVLYVFSRKNVYTLLIFADQIVQGLQSTEKKNVKSSFFWLVCVI